MAWQRISPSVIANGFMKCCMSNVVGGDDMLWNDSKENRDVRIEC
jgi:hypothetical protein